MIESNNISCDICRDLFPLVKDGVASSDSENAVKQHINTCPECKKMFASDDYVPSSNSKQSFIKVKNWLTTFYALLMMFGISFGLSLTAEQDLFFNCLIMPIVGVLGYMVFRKKSVFIVPVLLLIVGFFTHFLGMFQNTKGLDLSSLLSWTIVYYIFSLIGIIIAGLLHFAFKKEK